MRKEVKYEPRRDHGEHYVIASLAVEGVAFPIKDEGWSKLEAAEELAGALGEIIESLLSAAGRGSCDMGDGCPPDHGGLYPDAKFCEGCTLGPLLADLRGMKP